MAAILAGLSLVGGCATDTRALAAAAPTAVGDQVFAVGYGRIAEIYLQPVDMARIGTDGLSGLGSIDPHLKVERTGSTVRLLDDGRMIGEFAVPRGTDAGGWAALTARVVERARVASALLREASTEQIYQAVFDAVMLDLDSYSRYTGAQRATSERSQREGYGGIGITHTMVAGRHLIREVIPGGPAARAGIRLGEAILAIDGDPTDGMGERDVRDRLRGPASSLVLVTVGTDPGQGRRLALRRERVIPNTATVATDGSIGILRVERFNAATAANLREAILTARRSLGSRATGFILDLRGNPGGLLDQAVAVADLFIPHGRIITTEGRHPDSRQRFDAAGDDLIDGLPLVVLVDGRSASAAEVVAAALQDSGRAVIVGAASYGKGSVQTVTRLPNDGELFLTWSRIYAPSGYTLHRQGVLPSICTSRDVGDAESLVSQLRDGRLALPAALASWRIAAPDDEKALAQLRETCPWKAHEPDLDLRVAKLLLNERPLYQRALALTNTTVAER